MRLHIEKIITGGMGLARREDGMVVLTRFVLPGETVTVRETRKHRGYVEAEITEVLEPSPDRVAPPCPFYGTCGGCDFQHINFPAQLRFKEEMIREALLRARIPVPQEVMHPVLPSPRPYKYRYRIRLKLAPSGQIGFFQARSNDIVDIDRCPVATDLLNSTLLELRGSQLPAEAAAFIREVDLLHSPTDDRVHVLLYPEPGKSINVKLLAECTFALPQVQGVWIKTKSVVKRVAGDGGSGLLHQDFAPTVCGRPFSLHWPPGSFSQVNAEQNCRLISLVMQLAGRPAGKRVLDLFCGMGNFSVPLTLNGAQVTGVERNQESVTWARNNAAAAGCATADFIAADVAKALTTSGISGTRPELIVLDPPRQGLARECSQLANLGAGKIIYVSCDPATLMRDLAKLCAKGYRLTDLTPVDMFPQTHHIETVALLEKN